MDNNKHTAHDELDFDPQVDDSPEPDRPAVTETPIKHTKRLRFGRHISFRIEEAAVQMAAVSHFGRRRRIIELNKFYLTAEQVKSHERLTLITKAINDFLVKHHRYFSVMSIVISGRETALRSFLMPAIKKSDLDSAIKLEASTQLPFPIEDCTYDYRPISRIVSGNRQLYNISLLGATRRLIQEKMEPLDDRKELIEHIYHAPDVVGKLMPYLKDFNPEESYTAVNIGMNQSEISFYKGSALEFYSVLSVGSSMLGKTPDKIGYDFLAESLASEIQTSIDFYTGRYSRPVSNRILVYGDLAYSEEIVNSLKGTSGYQFQRFPVEKINFLPAESLEENEVQIPACLPAFVAACCPEGMSDLLPPENKKARKDLRLVEYAKIAVIFLMLILISSSWLIGKVIDIKQDSITSLNHQVNYFVQSEAYRTYNILKQQIAVDQAYLATAKENPNFLSLNLKELSHLTPANVRLLHFQFHPLEDGQNLLIQGLVYSDKIPPEVILAEFVENMTASSFYDQVKIDRYVKKDKHKGFEIDFTLKCRGLI